MPDAWIRALERELSDLRDKGRLRSLRDDSGLDFGSNDYLGFAENPELRSLALEAFKETALSASSSRLLPGHHAEHHAAEEYFATFVGAESCLFFNSGYDANMTLLTTLPTRHDVVLYDERSHASIYEGVHASLARSRRFAHNSAADLQNHLERENAARQIFVVLESVYSMDGDVAALEEIAEVASRFNAVLFVDEAHATGVLGTHGEGLVKALGRNDRIVSLHTCGKALGASGAFVAGSRTITDFLINKARPFIYTTALPPIIPLQIVNALRLLEQQGEVLVTDLRARSKMVRGQLQSSLLHWHVPDGITPIISIIIGEDKVTIQASQVLKGRGFVVPAVRPPTVPEGTARLRLNVSLRHTEEELRGVVEAMRMAEEECAG